MESLRVLLRIRLRIFCPLYMDWLMDYWAILSIFCINSNIGLLTGNVHEFLKIWQWIENKDTFYRGFMENGNLIEGVLSTYFFISAVKWIDSPFNLNNRQIVIKGQIFKVIDRYRLVFLNINFFLLL